MRRREDWAVQEREKLEKERGRKERDRNREREKEKERERDDRERRKRREKERDRRGRGREESGDRERQSKSRSGGSGGGRGGRGARTTAVPGPRRARDDHPRTHSRDRPLVRPSMGTGEAGSPAYTVPQVRGRLRRSTPEAPCVVLLPPSGGRRVILKVAA
jgi:hypothetical protein